MEVGQRRAGMVRWGILAGIVAGGCAPHAGFETARVAPAGTTHLTAGGSASASFGRRHDYALESRAGEVSTAGNQHQPNQRVEAVLLGRAARGLVRGLELDVTGWNPLLLPPLGLGGAVGLKAQLVGGDGGPLGVALGGRAGGFAHILGESGNSRSTLLGLLEARAVISAELGGGISVSLVPHLQLEAVHDRLSDSDAGTAPAVIYSADSARAIYGVSLGLAGGASDRWFIDLAAAFAARSSEDPAFSRWTVGLARRIAP